MRSINKIGKQYIALLMICVMMIGLLPVGVYADVLNGLQTSIGGTSYNKNGAPVVIDPSLTIEVAGNITEARVMIRNFQVGDTLHYTTTNGISGTFNTVTGILSLTGVTTAENYQNALRSIRFSTTGDTTSRTIDFILGSGLYFQGTGHFYEYVSNGSVITWQNAKNQAETRSFYGRQGYLVNITSGAENAFVLDKTEGIGWIGARDINRNVLTGAFITGNLINGDWRWVTGPEGLLDEGKGLKFFSGYHPSSNPLSVDGVYNNWVSEEPNSYVNEPEIGEWVVHMFGKASTADKAGRWNDYNNASADVLGYIVEYGGMPSDTPINIQASKVITINDTPVYPSTIVNGGFEYPVLSGTANPWWTNYTPADGDASFGWRTTATTATKYEFGGDWGVNAWGVSFIPEGRQFIELNVTERAAVYQDLATTPGEVIYWSLYQGGVWYSINQNINNTMAVKIGTIDQLPVVTMIDADNTTYDQPWTNRIIYDIDSKTVAGSLPDAYIGKDNNKKQLYTEPKRWTKYEGIYVVPEGQTVTRFAFSSLAATPQNGNLLDGVVFRSATQQEIDALKSDAEKLAEAKVAILAALNNLSVNNATTADSVISVANNASLYGVTVAWDGSNGFSKVNATLSSTGSITGILNLTLNAESDSISLSKTILQLPAVNEPIQEIPTEPQTQSVTDNQVKVIVNGKAENAGTEINSTVNGKSVAHVTVNNAVVESRLNEGLTNNNLEAIKLLQILVADKKSDIVNVALTGDIIKKLEDNAFIVSVKRDNVEYVIPSQEFTISNVAKNLGVSETALKDIEVEVRISKVDEKTIEQYNQVARANGAELVFPPISFEVVAKTTQPDGTTQEININKFSNYVERIMEIPSGIDPSKVTTGIVFNADGSYSHVPTAVFQKDGKWYAKLNSLTNSQYSIISNQVTVKSVENHWAKDAVNDMASRLVISSPEAFKPDLAITRADFAAYLVRALGLYREGVTFEDTFKDVKTQGGKNLAIMIASENGIITGYTDGTFKPDATITREEAMAMYHNAMKIVALKGSDSSRYLSYDDFSTVGKWAQSYVKEVLAAHVFNGTKGNSISPKSILTYAEAAQAIQNLLVASELINE